MTDLSPEARRMLAQARVGQARAPEPLRARVKDNVARAIAAAAVGGDRPGARLGRDEAATVPAWTFSTVAALAVLGGVAVFATQPASVSRPATDPVQSQQFREQDTVVPPSAADTLPAQRTLEQDTVAPQVDEPGTVAEAIAPSQPAERSRNPVVPGPDDLRAEMQLLSRAEASLRSDDPEGALQVLRTYAQQFRRGQLQDEREGLRLIALCALGRGPKAALARYLDKKGDAVLHARVLEACSGRMR